MELLQQLYDLDYASEELLSILFFRNIGDLERLF